MTLAGAIERELPFLRAEAEALFTDVFDLRNYGDGWHYDETSKQDVRDFTLLYSAPGKLISKSISTDAQAGDRTVTSINRELHLPWSTAPVAVGTVAVRQSDGAQFEVLSDVTNAHPKTRRLQVEQVLT